MSTSTSPSRYAVVGNPVSHSKSPLIHAMFAKQTGERIEYGRLEAPLDGFKATVEKFAAEGASGCNVTLPFKLEALQAGHHRSERAELAQAANWLQFDKNGWRADNTDGVGLQRDIEVNAGVPLAGKRVLIIGAGGAAGGVLAPLMQSKPALIVTTNRTPSKAQALVERHGALAERLRVPLQWAPIESPFGKENRPFDIVINATSRSIGGSSLPVPPTVFGKEALAIDLMYGAPARLFLDWAEQHGARTRDGLGMLVEQANEAFFLWRGVRPDSAPVLAALQAPATPGAGSNTK